MVSTYENGANNVKKLSRRGFISKASGVAVAGASLASSGSARATALQLAQAEPTSESRDYWSQVRGDYDTPSDIINLEHGYWTEMARPVRLAFEEHTRRINRDGAYYARRHWGEDRASVIERLAGYLKCQPSELALTRNATEALQALIGGYRPLERGDAVLYADLDYGPVKNDFETLASTRGAKVVTIAIPEPVSYDNVIEAYETAMDDHPNIKYMVLTHVSNQTGLLVPVREIVERARERGVDVIVDAAHSWGQVDFTLEDLGADFVAFNLHKWIGAPLGAGFLYIRENRLSDIARNMSYSPDNEGETTARAYYGTPNFAVMLAVHDALDYSDKIGWARKAEYLNSLRDMWAEPARKLDGVEVLTPSDSRLNSAITSFRLKGQTTAEENEAVAKRLLDEFGLFTVDRGSPEKGACIRVTPMLSNSPEDCERMYKALAEITA